MDGVIVIPPPSTFVSTVYGIVVLVPGTVLKVPVKKNDSPVRALDYVAQN